MNWKEFETMSSEEQTYWLQQKRAKVVRDANQAQNMAWITFSLTPSIRETSTNKYQPWTLYEYRSLYDNIGDERK